REGHGEELRDKPGLQPETNPTVRALLCVSNSLSETNDRILSSITDNVFRQASGCMKSGIFRCAEQSDQPKWHRRSSALQIRVHPRLPAAAGYPRLKNLRGLNASNRGLPDLHVKLRRGRRGFTRMKFLSKTAGTSD